MVKGSVMTEDGLCGNITVPIMEDLHLRKFPPIDLAHNYLDFTCLRNSANLSTEQQVMFLCIIFSPFLVQCYASAAYTTAILSFHFSHLFMMSKQLNILS